MISETQAVRRLAHESGVWKRGNLDSDYVRGVRHGLYLAALIIRSIWDETKVRLIDNPKHLATVRGHFTNKKYVTKGGKRGPG